MKIDAQFASFAPKDLTAITGLSPAMQRDWRRAGHLPAREGGWSTFSLMDICAVAVRKVIADAGLGPAFANKLLDGEAGQNLVASVQWWALAAQDVDDWLVDAGQPFANEVRTFDARDHFALVHSITGLHHSQRFHVVTINPIKGSIVFAESSAEDIDEENAIEFTLRLTAIGSRIASRASRGLVKIRDASVGRGAEV